MTDAHDIEAVARRLLGEPNPHLSTRAELRFGAHGSISVVIAGEEAGSWYDHENQVGGGIKELLKYKGIDDLFDRRDGQRDVIRYAYRDEQGELLFWVCRGTPKRFWQEQPGPGKGGVMRDAAGKPTMQGARLVPYRLPDIHAARRNRNGHAPRVYLVEGEKDADRLASWGLVATTNPGGAGKWRDEYSPHFAGCDIVIIPDNDHAGRTHADQVARSLAPHVDSVKLIILQGLDEKGDVSDWIADGGTQSTLEDLADAAPVYEIGGDSGDEQLEPLPYVTASDRAKLPEPVRRWMVSQWLPMRQVALLGGNGGEGKTTLALQLMVAAATGSAWLGLPVMRCRAFGLFAEDDCDEIDVRLRGLADLNSLGDLAWHSETDLAELMVSGLDGRLRETVYYTRFRAAVLHFRARLVVIDAAANTFGGDELRRREVAAFIRLLRHLACEIDGCVLLLSHPSNSGLTNNTGISGSTAWRNSTRSVLVFGKPEEEETDPRERVLRLDKSNYSAPDAIRLRRDDGCFVAIGEPGIVDRVATAAKAERVFLELLRESTRNGVPVSPNPAARTYGPTVFARNPSRERLSKHALETAMLKLLRDGAIGSEPYGSASKRYSRLVLK